MANDNKEIGEIVKKCKILLLDIEGTTTSISFVKVGLMIDRPVFCFTLCLCVIVFKFCYTYHIFLPVPKVSHKGPCKMVAISDSQYGGRNQNGTPFHAAFIV